MIENSKEQKIAVYIKKSANEKEYPCIRSETRQNI